jgi:peptidoglycan/LPS O-acetylase OafA/YrhL
MPLAFNPVLHGLRGLAALGVVLFHWMQIFPGAASGLSTWRWGPEPWMNLSLPLANGWQGVPLFFVLSGFLLTSQWLARPLAWPAVRTFWWRRFLRIYPAVWLQLLVLLALAAGGWAWLGTGLGPRDWVLNALLWLNLPPAMTAPINGVWWTLPVELAFYLALPGLVWLARRIGWGWVLVLAWGVTVGWRAVVMQAHAGESLAPHLHILDALPGSLATFVAGCALAAWRPVGQASAGRRQLAMLLLLAGYAGLQYLLWTHDAVYLRGHWLLLVWVPALGLLTAMGVRLLCRPLAGWGWLSARPLVWLGEVSFGVYLWHYPVQTGMARLWPAAFAGVGGSMLALVLSLVVTLVLAALSFHGLEQRVSRWGGGMNARA